MKSAYIDHNILDFFFKNPGSPLQKNLAMHRMVIFSEENLNEIEKCGDRANEYARIFETLNPQYLVMRFDQTGRVSDTADLRPYPVSGCLKIRTKNHPNYAKITHGLSRSLLKSLGGLKEKTVEDAHNEKAQAYKELAVATGKDADHYTKNMEDDLKETRQFLAAQNGYAGSQTIRESVGVSPLVLNNIKGPDVIKKIWAIISQSNYAQENEITFDRFFGLDHISKNAEGKRPLHTQINLMYLMLNMIGYKTDKNWLNEERFTTAYSDGKHVAYASFSDELISMDARLCEKARAVYRHFEIATDVVHLVK